MRTHLFRLSGVHNRERGGGGGGGSTVVHVHVATHPHLVSECSSHESPDVGQPVHVPVASGVPVGVALQLDGEAREDVAERPDCLHEGPTL